MATSGQLTLTTTAQIVVASQPTPPAVQFVVGYPMSAAFWTPQANVYLGGAGVTSANGFLLPANVILTADVLGLGPESGTADDIWGLTASGTATLYLLRRGT